jgi:hypothetical protein
MWRFRNKTLPANTFLVLSSALELAGAEAPTTLWGIPEAQVVEAAE